MLGEDDHFCARPLHCDDRIWPRRGGDRCREVETMQTLLGMTQAHLVVVDAMMVTSLMSGTTPGRTRPPPATTRFDPPPGWLPTGRIVAIEAPGVPQ
jgi:hypothetical protein